MHDVWIGATALRKKQTMIPVILVFLSIGYPILTGAVSMKSLMMEFSLSELNFPSVFPDRASLTAVAVGISV